MEAIHYFSLQVPAVTYSAVRASRQQWWQQRSRYSFRGGGRVKDRGPADIHQHQQRIAFKTHLYTVASENNTELQNLEFTAALAGVQLKVLGVGLQYTSWLQKLEWYAAALLDDDQNDVADDDLLVLMDAYDVLLTPMIRRLGVHLSRAATPLLACAEYGQYPEPEAAWLYPRGSFSPPRSDHVVRLLWRPPVRECGVSEVSSLSAIDDIDDDWFCGLHWEQLCWR